MGGCATKPKVLKGDERDVPVPAPPPKQTKEPVPEVPEAKKVADVVAAKGKKKVEADFVEARQVDIVNDDKVDDHANKQRSISNLFKENEKKGAAESDNTTSEPSKNESLEPVKQQSSEPVRQEPVEPVKTVSLEPVQIKSVEPVKQELSEPEKQAPSDTEKLKEAYVTRNQETEEPAKPIEQTYNPEIESAQSLEAKPAPEAAAAVNVPETQKNEISADDKEGKTENTFVVLLQRGKAAEEIIAEIK
ncbi:enolase-phosphatase E1-like [Durio zibethinus]|uniref:Enolase-phosphatase E1-like n=1 Tax=Durio zibethinus TaxID=66656 RepID=A0A6P5YKN3_DURZI|nr:enolase-phosphatase E1-like [Durio zibethinus]